MREIKFRAWDTKRRIMLPEFDIVDAMTGSIGDVPENLIFLQYTGLKDKNGNEIYEGDILATKGYRTNKYIYPRVVVFDEFGVSTEPGSGHETVIGWGMKDEELGEIENIDTRLEVIGNIYENPELLKLK